MTEELATAGRRSIVGGVDTHKDLHFAAVVDEHDRILGSESFPTTPHGYKQMLLWMRSFGDLVRGASSAPEAMAPAYCANWPDRTSLVSTEQAVWPPAIIWRGPRRFLRQQMR
ncbi:hypothetical protein LMG22931_07043 [Paraburkholderia nemoris]|nr:hypothetical protein LMG22931_07043 [Paraburkholderia nemoris]